MAKARAIVKRLKAVRNIRKITRTMELIATARFKKAMDRATEAKAYTQKLSEIVADLSAAQLRFTHPLLQPHETDRRGVLLVLTANRGMCGGYNANVLRLAMQRIGEYRTAGRELVLEVSGRRGLAYMKFQRQSVDRRYLQFEDKPRFDEVEQIADRYINDYIKGHIDRVDVAYTRFESASKQRAVVDTLLPIERIDQGRGEAGGHDFEFLPSPAEILQELVPAAFKARLFKCFLDAAVSEQIARMVAMKRATENAAEMIHTLSLQYNRARQTQITAELSEIIGGAAALE
ncbi:MAG: ATP synthase F1 subunit gamma [Planctomycetota bacterium]|nr:MAG: ATP synthase F1 subunit gamma [Planctomycetota bacterium]